MINFIGNHSHEVRNAIQHTLQAVGAEASATPSQVFVLDGTDGINDDVAHTALESGHTLAILNARKGQLAGVDPGTGIEVPSDLALFAVKRMPIRGHSRPHTVITMVANSDAMETEGFTSDINGTVTPHQQPTPIMSLEHLTQQLKLHVESRSNLDSNLIPPSGTKFATTTLNLSFGWPVAQNFGWSNNGTTQNFLSRTSSTFYFYFANGNGQAVPQYVILMVQNGTCFPATSGPIANNKGERCFALGTDMLQYTVNTGTLTLVMQSPGPTTSSPVMASVEYPMTVMAYGPGGLESTPFTPSTSMSTENPDWGVASQPGSANEANWLYYNITGWNALTQTGSNFGNWGQQMYNDDDLNELDAQCMNGTNYATAAIWTIPQNPNNASPLNVQLGYRNTYLLEGFVNRGNSGSAQSDMMGWTSGWCGYSLPYWDMVSITGSQPDAINITA